MAKLSKREQAAKKAGGSLDYKSGKISVAPKVTAKPKAVAPLAGAGPLLPGQTRQANSYGGGSQLQGAGPLLPGQTRAKDSYKGGQSNDVASRRREAAKAANIKNAGFDLTSAVNSGGLSVNEFSKPVSQRQATLGQGSKGGILDLIKNKAMGAFGSLGEMVSNDSQLRAVPGYRNTPEQLAENRKNLQGDINSGLGVYNANASDIPFGAGEDYNGIFQPQQQETDFTDPYQSGGITAQEPTDTTGRSRFAELFAPTASAQEDPYRGNGRGNNTNFDNTEEVSGIDPTLQSEMMMSPADAPLVDNPGPTVGNRSGRGSGMFATGKGLMSEDPYIKELRKAYSTNGGEKWLRKQFDELIKALDPTYAQMQKEGTDALNAQLNNQNIQLASVMNANNTGDSEQRAQLMAGQQRDTQTALGNLLAKLAQNKSQDVSQYKSEYAKQRGQLAERNQSNQQTLIDKIRAYQQSQAKGQGGAANGKSLQALLTKAANMTSGGAQWAQRNAGLYGLNAADVTPYLQGNWGDGFRSTPAPSRNTGGDTIQELADTLGVDYATAQKMYLAEQGY